MNICHKTEHLLLSLYQFVFFKCGLIFDLHAVYSLMESENEFSKVGLKIQSMRAPPNPDNSKLLLSRCVFWGKSSFVKLYAWCIYLI